MFLTTTILIPLFLLFQTISSQSSSNSSENPPKTFLSFSSSYNETKAQIICPIFGTILYIITLILQWRNERTYIISSYRVEAKCRECKELDHGKLSKIEPSNYLVYVKGTSSSDDTICDPDFPSVLTSNAVKLIRKVEIYQWKEFSENDDQGILRHTYFLQWCNDYVSSENFAQRNGHMNKESDLFLNSNETNTPNVLIGHYLLPEELKQKTKNKKPLKLDQNIVLSSLGEKFKEKLQKAEKHAICENNYIYISRDRGNMQSGDLRINFEEVKCGPTTVIGELIGNTFGPHTIKSEPVDQAPETFWRGCLRCGLEGNSEPINEIFQIYEKILTKKQAFIEVIKARRRKFLHGRAYLIILNIVGVFMDVAPLLSKLDFIHSISILYPVIKIGTAFLFSPAFSLASSFTVIGMAWLKRRPLKSLLLLVFAGALIFALFI